MSVDILARLKINAQEFARGMKNGFAEAAHDAERGGTDAGNRFATSFGRTVKFAIGAAVGRELLALGQRALDYTVNLQKMADQTGLTTAAVQEYNFAARTAGVSQDELASSFTTLIDKIGAARSGNKAAAESFAALGVDVNSAAGTAGSFGIIFDQVVKRIGDIADPIERARIGTALYGGEWERIAPLLSSGKARLDELRQAAHEMGVVLSDDQLQMADRTAKKLEAVKSALETRIANIVIENSQAILGIANAIGAAASAVDGFFRTMNGVDRIKKHEGWAAGFFSSFGRQMTASTPEGYYRDASARFKRAESDRKVAEADWKQSPTLMNAARLQEAREREANARSLRQKAFSDPDFQAYYKRLLAGDPAPSGNSGFTLPTVVAPTSGAGRARGGSSRAANDNSAARAAEQARREDERRLETLRQIIERERDDLEIANIRITQGNLAAELAEARMELERQFPGYAQKTVDEIARQLGITKEEAQVRKDNFDLAVKMTAERIKSADAAKQELAFLDQQYEQAQAIFSRIAKEREQQQREAEETIDELAWYLEDAFSGNFKNLWKQFEYQGIQALANVAAQKTISLLGGNAKDVLQTIVGGASLGAGAASMTGGSGLGGSVGGAMGGAAAKELFGKALGSFAGPLGSVLGGVLGGAIGGLLRKTTYGTARLTGNDEADVSVTGNNGSARSGASGAARTVQEGLAEIADALGATVGDYLVSIGKYDNEWRVSTTGYTGKLNFKGDTSATGKGLYGFYDDEAGAIAFAIQDALSDGAIRGISAAAQRILQSGQDLEAAIEKAVNIESIPKLLRQRLDPLGAALDEVDAKYKKLADTLKEGGASIEQITQAQQLWQLERAETIKSVGSLSEGLKSFLSSLKAGDSSPLSLREQQANAMAALAPYRSAIEAGQSIDTDAFQEVAQTFLSVERQINGSTQAYFSQYSMITGLLEKAIAQIDAQASGTDAAADPFSELIAQATQASANILEQQTTVLTDMRTLLEKLTSGTINWSDYITATRGMAA